VIENGNTIDRIDGIDLDPEVVQQMVEEQGQLLIREERFQA
jgi:hypothetical protein